MVSAVKQRPPSQVTLPSSSPPGSLPRSPPGSLPRSVGPQRGHRVVRPRPMAPQPVQYRRLPSGDVIRVVMAPGQNPRMPKAKKNRSKKYDMRHVVQDTSLPKQAQTGIYKKNPTGWQSLTIMDKVTV